MVWLTSEVLLGEVGSGPAVEWASSAGGGDVSVRVDLEVPSACSAHQDVSRVLLPRVGTIMVVGVSPSIVRCDLTT
mgnify:CR=1 FL=1